LVNKRLDFFVNRLAHLDSRSYLRNYCCIRNSYFATSSVSSACFRNILNTLWMWSRSSCGAMFTRIPT